ncbi:MAG: right-handed parallel beta-helix repeat-containing protein, partial [Thermoplasmata archaeon]
MIACSLIATGFIGLLDLVSEDVQGGTNVSGTISQPGAIWDIEGSPYIVVDDVWVEVGATLTIEPGVLVKFNAGFSIYVQGNLIAIGTESDRINFTSNQATPTPGYWSSLCIEGQAEIQNCNITYGSGIILSGPSNTNISNNNVSFNRYGISLSSSSGNNITNNTMIENGIGIGGGTLESWNTHNIDTSNTVNGKPVYYWKNKNSGTIPPNAGEVILANCTNIIVENQEFRNGSVGVQLGFSSDNTLINNSMLYIHGNAVDIVNSDNNHIINNTISSDGSYSHGIIVVGSKNNNIKNNTILYLYGDGMNLHSSDGNNITGNNISYNGGEGIWLHSGSYRNTIKGNEFLSNDNRGVRVGDSGNNISCNIFYDNYMGITIGGHWNNITGNVISLNDYGIVLGSDAHNVNNNTVTNNDYGIFITEAFSNRIYHNNIINNTNQAYDDTSGGNQWDNGYPSGGNYWSDYDGFDNHSGPGQNEPGPDGIGDTPYFIDGDSLDQYPLMDPVRNFMFLYEGWNLISMPLIQSGTNVGAVLSSITGHYRAVQWFNASDSGDHWESNFTTR